MKHILILFYLLLSLQILYSEDNYPNYKVRSFPKGGPFFYDFRYLNYLEKNNEIIKANKIYNELIEEEINIDDQYKFYDYFYNERLELRKENYYWCYDTPLNIYNGFLESAKNKSSLNNYLPLSLLIGIIETDCYDNYGNKEVNEMLQINFNKKNYEIFDLEKISSDIFYFKIKIYNSDMFLNESKNGYLIFFIEKLKNTIYESINDKYELVSILIEDIGSFEISNCSKIGFEKSLIYGIKDYESNLFINQKYHSKVNNLRIRKDPIINNKKIIGLLKKDEMVTLLEIGNYEVIDDISGNWIKVKTNDNRIGWIFGGYVCYDFTENIDSF